MGKSPSSSAATARVAADGSERDVVRVAAVGDLHCSKSSGGAFQPLFAEAAEHADALVLCADLTDYGLPEEADLLVKEIPRGIPTTILAVLGNHDYEFNQQDELKKILAGAGVIMLDGDSCEV
jgi:hypothetical protein